MSMTNKKYTREELQQYAEEHFSLDQLAKDWEKMFYDLIEEKKTNPITPYQPTVPYQNHNKSKKEKIDKLISVIVPTNRIGGLDILFESLKHQTYKNFELVLVDAIYQQRKTIVEEKSKEYDFKIKHIEPKDNTFPISNYCKSINTGLCAAEGELVYFTCDYSYLYKDILLTHANFHSDAPEDHILMLPMDVCNFDHSIISKTLLDNRQYGTKGMDEKYKLMVASEEDYVSSHNKWSEDYAEDVLSGKLNDILWSIFNKPFNINDINKILIDNKTDLKFQNSSTHTPTPAFHDLLCLKNDSFNRNFLMKANGMDEDLDGSHGYQDTELTRRLFNVYGAKFFAINKLPVKIFNTRYYLEPRKIVKGYNNIEIINKKYMREEPIINNTITQFKGK